VDPESSLARQIVLLDSIATRYHCLPSEVVRSGDTLDVFIINAAIDIHRYMDECAKAQAEGKPKPARKLSQEQMKAMLERVRNGNKKSKR
jgi:hypothetical protein